MDKKIKLLKRKSKLLTNDLRITFKIYKYGNDKMHLKRLRIKRDILESLDLTRSKLQ